MGNLVFLIGSSIGACLPLVLLYAIVQRWIRRRDTTAMGYMLAISISLVIAAPSMRKDEQRKEAIQSQTQTLAQLEGGCNSVQVPLFDCKRIASCVLTKMEARYPTDEAWLKFARRAQANESGIKEWVADVSEECRDRLYGRNRH